MQDALGYRTDQNAPFNPTYSLPNVPVSHFRSSRRARFPPAAKLVPGGVQPDLQTPTLISWSLRVEQELTPNTALTLGYVGSHGYHEIIGIDANEPFPGDLPGLACPATYPSHFPAPASPARRFPPDLLCPHRDQANPRIANTWT